MYVTCSCTREPGDQSHRVDQGGQILLVPVAGVDPTTQWASLRSRVFIRVSKIVETVSYRRICWRGTTNLGWGQSYGLIVNRDMSWYLPQPEASGPRRKLCAGLYNCTLLLASCNYRRVM